MRTFLHTTPFSQSRAKLFTKNGGDDETRTRDLCRDSERFISTYNDLQEHGRHPKSLQDSLRHRHCVPRVYHAQNPIALMVSSVSSRESA